MFLVFYALIYSSEVSVVRPILRLRSHGPLFRRLCLHWLRHELLRLQLALRAHNGAEFFVRLLDQSDQRELIIQISRVHTQQVANVHQSCPLSVRAS